MNGTNRPECRFWLSARTTFASSDLIRVAWLSGTTELSALGYVDDTRVVFDLGPEVPARIASDALEAAYSQADYGDAHVPPGWTFEGYETSSEMERQVACRCQACGVVLATDDELSTDAECPKCWVSRMAEVAPAPVVAGTPEWLQTLWAGGQL